ncbi:unnamed protein product [Prorocentrum cordatum]|uniref:Cytochrome c domain-containing protein n=1 Tax=Prorocentrum cordatum TaxID=2364126 RepID=A0ABN9SP81_9DINO|nr:unnamed protein product [Polarella glacialis]
MPVLGRLQRRSSSALDRSPAPAWPLVVPPRVVRGPSWLEALAPEAPEKPPHQAPPRGPGHHGRPEGRELRAAWHLRAGPARPAAGLRRPSGQQRPAAAGAALLGLTAGPARAEIEDVAIPVDGKGKTRNLSKEELIRGKRLFNVACGTCHVGGGTRTNQSVGLGIEELSGAFPPRNTIDSLVDYINAPTTYDGLKDISEVHPSIIAADLWPKMRSMKQQDLYDISAYILYQNYVIPEKWGGGKQYY